MYLVRHTASSPAALRTFIDAYHPLRTGGALKGLRVALWGYEDAEAVMPVFLAVFVTPRARWRTLPVSLELTRLVISPHATRSASTFLRACHRYLRRHGYTGYVVTYALPGTEGLVYQRAGWQAYGTSSGASWSRRGPGERPTPKTIGDGIRLQRYILPI